MNFNCFYFLLVQYIFGFNHNKHFSNEALYPIRIQDGSLLLTSSSFVKPLSSLWKIGETQDHKFNFVDDYYVEFSKAYQNRIIGTRESTATVKNFSNKFCAKRFYSSLSSLTQKTCYPDFLVGLKIYVCNTIFKSF